MKGNVIVTLLACSMAVCLMMPMAAMSGSMIQIKGSDTEVNLVQHEAETFMETRPEVSIAVTGGGSGTGIAALINKKADIANCSRPLKEEERKLAAESGVTPVEVPVAIDGIAVIVHPSNPIDHLTLEQVGRIFQGEITNWKAVGGPDMMVSLYGRQSNSGTYVFFQEHVLNKKDYSTQMKNMNGNAQIVEAIKTDKAGIGYVGIGYVSKEGTVIPGIKVFRIAKEASSKPISPTEADAVMNRSYPITRYLYQYTNGVPTGAIKDFLAFFLSDKGQDIVKEEGFYPLPQTDRQKSLKILGVSQ
jgi:phosphate transport system substrate-binding protein